MPASSPSRSITSRPRTSGRMKSSCRYRSAVRKLLQGRVKAQTSVTHQCGAENLGLVIGKSAGKTARHFQAGEQRAHQPVRKGRVLVGGELPLPGPLTDSIGAGRPEVRAAADEHAVAENKDSAVAALHAVEHLEADRIKPVLHKSANATATWNMTNRHRKRREVQ